MGNEEQRFVVHRSIITQHSAFFRAALEKGFRESAEKIIRLPEADVKTFEVYMQWAYHGSIVTMTPEEQLHDLGAPRRFANLADLYVLADRLEDMGLRNATIEEIKRVTIEVNNDPGPEAIAIAYENTHDTSKLREYVRDCYAHSHGGIEWFEEHRSGLPTAFIFEVMLQMKKAKGKLAVTPSRETGCKYHEHGDDVSQCARD